ncbi:MAG: GTP 3',8-cyclase MoaA [Thermoplasmata archaeon]
MKVLKDKYGREINYIRFSVTNKCNLNCFYCHKEGIEKTEYEMDIKTIESIFKNLSSFGIKSIKITGGEPLQRNDLVYIISLASKYFEDVSMTTNGIGLYSIVQDLYNAGLGRINISLHTLKRGTYKKITGHDMFEDVMKSIHKVREIPFRKKKINMVYLKGINDNEILNMIDFASEIGFTLQVIELESSKDHLNDYVFKNYHKDLSEVRMLIESFKNEKYTKNLHNREIYVLEYKNKKVEVELVEPMFKHEFCMHCTRLRLTPDGKYKPCIFRNDNLVDAFSENSMENVLNHREPYW